MNKRLVCKKVLSHFLKEIKTVIGTALTGADGTMFCLRLKASKLFVSDLEGRKKNDKNKQERECLKLKFSFIVI